MCESFARWRVQQSLTGTVGARGYRKYGEAGNSCRYDDSIDIEGSLVKLKVNAVRKYHGLETSGDK